MGEIVRYDVVLVMVIEDSKKQKRKFEKSWDWKERYP